MNPTKLFLQQNLKQLKKWLTASSSLLLFILIWEAAPRLGLVDATLIAPPSVVVQAISKIVQDGTLFLHAAVSFQRAVWGFSLAMLVAVPVGFMLGGWFTTVEKVLTPLLYLLEKVNPFALLPVFILFFGIGEASKVAIIFWVCQWPILGHTITAVKSVDPNLIKSARSMAADPVTLFFKVVLPAATPGIVSGIKVGSQLAFFMIIAAEMVGSSKGLGWLVHTAQSNFQIPLLFAGTVVISFLGVIINQAFSWLEYRLVNWKETTFSEEN